jgi:hypothetical protein
MRGIKTHTAKYLGRIAKSKTGVTGRKYNVSLEGNRRSHCFREGHGMIRGT